MRGHPLEVSKHDGPTSGEDVSEMAEGAPEGHLARVLHKKKKGGLPCKGSYEGCSTGASWRVWRGRNTSPG